MSSEVHLMPSTAYAAALHYGTQPFWDTASSTQAKVVQVTNWIKQHPDAAGWQGSKVTAFKHNVTAYAEALIIEFERHPRYGNPYVRKNNVSTALMIVGGVLLAIATLVLICFGLYAAGKRFFPEQFAERKSKRASFRSNSQVSGSPSYEKRLSNRNDTLDLLLAESDEEDEAIDMRLRAKSMPALQRIADLADAKLLHKSLVEAKGIGDAELGQRILEANVRRRWAKKPMAEVRTRILKLEGCTKACTDYASRTGVDNDLDAKRKLERKAYKATCEAECLRKLLTSREGNESILKEYRERSLPEMEATLTELHDELADAMRDELELGGSPGKADEAKQREKRMSNAMRRAEFAEAALEQQRARRATLA